MPLSCGQGSGMGSSAASIIAVGDSCAVCLTYQVNLLLLPSCCTMFSSSLVRLAADPVLDGQV
jgi:uncharacterized protein involved in propanediol utilization